MTIQTREQAPMEFNDDKIALIKNTIAKGCTNDELDLFLHTCKRLGLDPILKQVYAIKRGGTMTIQTSIDGYRLIAERSGKYMPGKESTYVHDEKNRLISATSYVKRLGPDNQWHEVAATAFLAEYTSNQNLWNKMPHVMLAKCAESAALRRAFPAEMSGVYTEEEMSQASAIEHASVAPQSLITSQEAKNLDDLIGDDLAYKGRVLGFYKIDSFAKLPAEHLQLVMTRVKEHNDERLQQEMAIIEVK